MDHDAELRIVRRNDFKDQATIAQLAVERKVWLVWNARRSVIQVRARSNASALQAEFSPEAA